ncbi:MAG TPA: hypothetical protein VHU91_06395 [Mycobacteriales bacterium]|nr:hypothetical protein [Mycobacteriales bacterium]
MPPSRQSVEPEDELYYDDELEADAYSDDEPRPDRRQVWIRRLFWVGTALAPIAAVLLVMGQGVNPLRAAAALAIIGVVCIGLSVTLRDNSSTAHAELAEDLQREVDEVRAELETLRRGVQLTVNRELGRVRGELEAAQQVLHTEATRLPAQAARPEPPVADRGRPVGIGQSVRANAVAESAGASPIPPQLPSGSVYGDAAYSTGRQAPRKFDESGASNGSAGRPGSYSDYDPLASTASHPVVSRAVSSRRALPDPHTVEPIRERYASSQVPSPRSSTSPYSDSASGAGLPDIAGPSAGLRGRPRDGRGDDVVFGDVLPPQRNGGKPEEWNWANSASTQDWTPDFDLPSLDGLPKPGYAAASSPEHSSGYRGGDRPSESGSQASSRPRPPGGRHSAGDENDSFWNR